MFGMDKRLDVIIFGASGFTGKRVIAESVKILENLKWGVAVRDEEKMREVLKEIAKKCGQDLSDVPILSADATDESSLRKMALRAKVIINCCSPYGLHGEEVVKACIGNGTHYVDLSVDPLFNERIQLKYDEQARKEHVYVVSACGFNSLPFDLGVHHLEQQFGGGDVNSVECFVETQMSDIRAGSTINYSLWESLVRIFSSLSELRENRRFLFQEPLPPTEPKHYMDLLKKAPSGNGWCLPLVDPLPDASVMNRSQRYFYEKSNKRPTQVEIYLQLTSLFYACVGFVLGIFYELFARFAFGRDLLLKYPREATFGFCSRDGPSDKFLEESNFSITFHGHGWAPKDEVDPERGQHTTPPKVNVVTKISGPNPGYVASPVCVLTAAKTIVTETNRLAGDGGALTPAACFSNTNIIHNLSKNGFSFEVILDKKQK